MKKTTLVLLVVPLALTGCSGEPSATEVERSASAFITELGKIIAPRTPKPLTLEKAEKLGCTQPQGATYVCDVTMTVSGGHMPEPITRTGPMKFVKVDGVWVASE